MATVLELVNETRRYLSGQNRLEYDRLNGAIATTTAESFTVEFSAPGFQATTLRAEASPRARTCASTTR